MINDATMPFVVGAEIHDVRSQSPLLMPTEKRKHGVTEDGSQKLQLLPSPPPEKWNRGEQQQLPPESSLPAREKQGVCKCKGRGPREQEACGCNGERKTISFDELPPYAREYFARLNAKHGGKIVHRPGDGIFSDSDDEDDKLIGNYNFCEDPWVKENLQHIEEEDKLVCCSIPFEAIDFKNDTKLYDELKVFGEKALAFFDPRYNQAACFQDIVTVTACPASCRHYLVTMKTKEPPGEYGEFWQLVIRGKVREGFLKAHPRDFVMLEYAPENYSQVRRDMHWTPKSSSIK